MEEMRKLVREAIRTIQALPEEGMRLKRLAESLMGLSAEETALFFACLYEMALEETRVLMNLLVDPDGLSGILGPDRTREVYRTSVLLGLGRVSSLFTNAAPYRQGVAGYEKEEEAAMEFVTLGHRRAMSKKGDRDLLSRLHADPDPMVIRNILNNPRTIERDVVKIASRRPGSPEVLKIVALHRTWSRRYSVVKALVLNPYAYPRISVVLAEFLHTPDLRTAAGDRNIHPLVRLSALEIMRVREKTR